MKKFLKAMFAGALAISMVACGGSNNGGTSTTTTTDSGNTSTDTTTTEGGSEKTKIGLSIAGLTMPYFVRMYEGFMEAAEEKGYEVVFTDGGTNAETTIKGLEDQLIADVKAIALSTNYSDACVDVLTRAHEAGIPLFYMGNLNLIPEIEEMMTFYEGTPSPDAGYLGGLWFASYLDSINYPKKELNTVRVSLISDGLIDRWDGFEKAMKEKGYTLNLINTVGDLTRENSLNGCEDMLQAHDDLDLFMGTAATSALGAYDATVNAGRTEVMVFGFDGEDEEIELIDADTNYIGTICQDPRTEGRVTVEAIDTVLKGGTVEKGYIVPAFVHGKGVGDVMSDEILGN